MHLLFDTFRVGKRSVLVFIGSDKPVNILNDFRIVCFVLALFLPVIPLIIAGIIQIVDVRLQHLQIL